MYAIRSYYGIIPFNLEGWVVGNGTTDYLGTLEKNGRVLRACVCSDIESQITAEGLH